jgi:hypothetical protein
MSTAPRRRVLRPPRTTPDSARRQQQIERRQTQLAKEQAVMARWMAKLKRAFHAMEKQQSRVARLEREIRQLQCAES